MNEHAFKRDLLKFYGWTCYKMAERSENFEGTIDELTYELLETLNCIEGMFKCRMNEEVRIVIETLHRSVKNELERIKQE